jgi:penicillin-binding protein 1A
MPRPAPTVPRFEPPRKLDSRVKIVVPPPLPADPPERSWKRRTLFWLLRWGFIASVWLGLAAALLLLWFCRDLPAPESALDAVRRPSLTL